ncbi:MAG: DNA-processing protein DprA [Clostridia bacterium]|nr:DNA-processing protein DprA [Clostridia bacterium]
MISDLHLWIWLQLSLGCGSPKVRQICETFGNVEVFYRAGRITWSKCGLFSPIELERMISIVPDDTDEIIAVCRRLGYRMVTPDDPSYPDRLRNITDYPAVLYICGDAIDFDDEVAVTIVGSRDCTAEGINNAKSISYNLTKSGALVVSGGARGIDSAAHEGAILAKGRTVAFLPCGINVKYLSQNEQLRNTISKNGALISELPPGTPVYRNNFRVRNRLMSGVSLGTLVVEAKDKSGSLITARHATEQGRDVFAVPGSINKPTSRGPNDLIAKGAKSIRNAFEILEEYIDLYPHKITIPDKYRAPAGKTGYRDFSNKIWNDRIDPVNDMSRANEKAYRALQSPKPGVFSDFSDRYSGYTWFEPSEVQSSDEKTGINRKKAAQELAMNYNVSSAQQENGTVVSERGGVTVHSVNILGRITDQSSANPAGGSSPSVRPVSPEKSSAVRRKGPTRMASQDPPEIGDRQQKQPGNAPSGLSGDALLIYNALGEETLHIDELSSRLSRPARSLALTLTEMEIGGYIISKPGRRFCRKKQLP